MKHTVQGPWKVREQPSFVERRSRKRPPKGRIFRNGAWLWTQDPDEDWPVMRSLVIRGARRRPRG